MKKITISILLLLIGLTTSYGQRAKQNLFDFYDWHLPKKAIAPELSTYSVEVIKDESNTEKLSLRVDDDVYNKYDQVLNFEKSKLISNSLDSYFNLNSFQYTLNKEEGTDLNFILGSEKFEFLVSAGKKDKTSEEPTYIGKLFMISPLKLTVLDKNKNNLFTKVIDDRILLGDISVKDNAAIKKRRVAIKAMVDELVANQKKYFDKAREEYGYALFKIASQVKDEIDFYREKSKKGVFYKVGKKKEYDIEHINNSIEEIKEFSKRQDSKEYNQQLKELLTKQIAFWDTEQAKYSESDSKEKKIKWALLANIVGAYTIIDDYNQALKYYGDTEDIDYKKDYLPNVVELGQQHKKLYELHHDATGKPHRNYKDLSFATTNKVIKRNESLEKGGFRDGYVITKSNDTIRGKVLLKGADSDTNGNVVSLNIDSGLGKSVKMTIVNAKGKEKSKYFDAKKNKQLVIGDQIFDAVKFKEGAMASGSEVDLSKMALGGATPKFVLRIYKSEHMSLYKHGKEIVIKKATDDKGYSTSTTGFTLSFKKKLSKLVSDCKELSQRAMDKEFENTVESLMTFANEYTNYKTK